MSGIQHDWALNPVTALEFYHGRDGRLLVLGGEGVYLKVFDAQTSALLTRCQVFQAQAIHGIAIQKQECSGSDLKLAIWGGRSFALLTADEQESIISRDVTSVSGSEHTALDWILDGAISPFSESQSCVFITAHSAAIRVQLNNQSPLPLIQLLPSPSQSILYSAHIVWTSVLTLMVAAGTVFGEIEVITWSLKDNEPAPGQLQFTFTGHEGSIFGVQISPEICGPDGQPTRLLASCSDDRTIRLWNLLSSLARPNIYRQDSKAQTTGRETGFGDSSNEAMSSRSHVAVVMGHASRIWGVKFLTSKFQAGTPTKVNVLSFGEDSTSQQWSLDSWIHIKSNLETLKQGSTTPDMLTLSLPQSAALVHLNTFAYHTGKHIWSTALIAGTEGTYQLATGGADGKISTFDVIFDSVPVARKSGDKHSDIDFTRLDLQLMQSWTIDDVAAERPYISVVSKAAETAAVVESLKERDGLSKTKKKKPAKVQKDALNRYCFIQENLLLVTTSFGRILLGPVVGAQSWQELQLPGLDNNDLRSYSITMSVPRYHLALLAGSNGVIYIYHESIGVKELCRVKGKVAALLDISLSDNSEILILVTVLGSEEAHIISVDPLSSYSSHPEKMFSLILPSNFIVTSGNNVQGNLILGSRNGLLAAYDLSLVEQSPRVFSDTDIQGYDAITTVIAVPTQNTMGDHLHFLTTSRNGTYSIFLLTISRSAGGSNYTSLDLVHQAVPPLGPMIESAWFEGSELFLYGFRSKNFVVWNETKQLEITSVECGGAHRSYTYLPGHGTGGAGNLAYTKASKLHLHTQLKPSHAEIKPGGHGREIKCCAVSRGKDPLIATGAEDTTIRIWHQHDDYADTQNSNLRCCAVIEKHTAGIQHLDWSILDDVDYLFSAGGNEEFYIWRITFIPGFGLGVVCAASLTDYSDERDLRIMSADVVGGHILSRTGSSSEKSIGESCFRISLAYSDSTIKQYNYSRQFGFQKISSGRYTSSCLTQIASPILDSHLLTAATDGYVAIWRSPDTKFDDMNDLGFISRTKIHQSAVLALDIQPLNKDMFILGTGGDDNALALTIFGDWKAVARVVIPSAHAAAITGVGFYETHRPNMYGLWTVGGDQRVKRWTIETKSDDKELMVTEMKEGDDVWCSVPDAGGLVTLQGRESVSKCLIWGNGLEIVVVKENL